MPHEIGDILLFLGNQILFVVLVAPDCMGITHRHWGGGERKELGPSCGFVLSTVSVSGDGSKASAERNEVQKGCLFFSFWGVVFECLQVPDFDFPRCKGSQHANIRCPSPGTPPPFGCTTACHAEA